MFHPLRSPAAVPALFSRGAEIDPIRRPGPPVARSRLANRSVLVLPALMLMAELPLVHGAATMLRLALPH